MQGPEGCLWGEALHFEADKETKINQNCLATLGIVSATIWNVQENK